MTRRAEPPERFPGIEWITRSGGVTSYSLRAASAYVCPRCGVATEVDPDAARDRLAALAFGVEGRDEPERPGFRGREPGYDFSCAGCGLAVRLLGGVVETPPWSSEYREAVHAVLEAVGRARRVRDPGK